MSTGFHRCTVDEMALLCSDLVDIARTLHQYGQGTLNIYGPCLIKTIQVTSHTPSNARIIAMCKVATASKACYTSLMQGETM